MKLIINFLKGLVNENGTVSSKRVAGIEVLQLVIVMVLGNQFTTYKLDMAVLVALLTFVSSCFLMNTFLQSRSMSTKGVAMSDVTKATGDNEAVKDILNADEVK